jgi:hypothetical protein
VRVKLCKVKRSAGTREEDMVSCFYLSVSCWAL